MAFLLNCIRLDRSRTKTRNQVTIVLNCDAKREESDDDDGSDGFATPRIYNWNQVERMTSNFAQVIGSGGYSKVYLGRLPSSTQVAVKIHLGSRLFYQVFKQELEILLRLDHHNTVNLLGYSDDSEEGALVFEYLAGGNLQEQLQGSSRVALPWRKRTVIAFQLTQAIEYLHEKCSPHIIHGDIKSSNILLDQKQNCKLCDFGSAKLGFSSMVLPPKMSPRSRQKMMIGSPGYADPHYLRTGIASKKNDIYGLGVVILELVSGKEAFSPERGQMLVHEASPLLKDIAEIETDFEMDKVAKFVDPRLGEEYDIEEAKELLLVAAGCLCQPPSLSPSATQILQDLEDKVPSVFYSVSKVLD